MKEDTTSLIGEDKWLGKTTFSVPDDPMRDVTVPGRLSNPEEWNNINPEGMGLKSEVNEMDIIRLESKYLYSPPVRQYPRGIGAQQRVP